MSIEVTNNVQSLLAKKADLAKQRDELDELLKSHYKEQRNGVIKSIKALMMEHGLSLEDLHLKSIGYRQNQGKAAGSSVPPKYKDPSTGATWSGRGRTPRWLVAAQAEGKSLTDFAI